MASTLQVSGTLRLDGPYGPLKLEGKGSVVELRVSRPSNLYSLLKQARRIRKNLPPPSVHRPDLTVQLRFWRIPLARMRL